MVCSGAACGECLKRCERYHKKSGEFLPVDARFFKVMIGHNYSKLMYLPPAFAKTAKDLKNKKIQIKDSQGDRWWVTVSVVDGLLAFEQGWQEFSQSHNLKEGDFLLFSYIKGKGSHFTANVFGRSGCERKNFSNETPRPSKKSRTDDGTTAEDQPYEAHNVSSGDRPISPSSVVSKDELQRFETNPGVENVDFKVSNLQMPVNFEDTMCMIDWNNRRYEEKQRNLLNDKSSFEMENRASDIEKIQEPLMFGPPQTETTQHDANLNASDPKTPVSCIGIVKPTKPEGDDAMKQTKTNRVQTNIVTGNSGEKFEKAVDVKKPSSQTKITGQIRKNVDDAQKAPPSSQTGGLSDAFMKKFDTKPSDNSNMKKCKLESVCKSPNGSFGLSPPVGSSKIAEREHATNSKTSFMATSAFKNSSGCHAVKKEPVEMEDKDIIFGRISCGGKEPAVVIPPRVKVEPNLSPQTISLDATASTFSAVVKNRFYLELSKDIGRATGKKRRRIEGMFVYLKDSVGRMWPVLYKEYFNGRAFTVNWATFCQENNIMPGDKCRFIAEDVRRWIYRVDVAHGSA